MFKILCIKQNGKQSVYRTATDEAKTLGLKGFYLLKKKDLIEYIKNNKDKPKPLGIQELRLMANQKKIKYRSHMPKDELAKALGLPVIESKRKIKEKNIAFRVRKPKKS